MERSPDGPDRHWSDAGVYDVSPGVWRVPLPLPDALRAVNVYLIEEDNGFVVIDSGWALDLTRDRFEEALAVLDAGIGDLRSFLITHAHRDHYTQAVALRRDFGMQIALGRGEQRSLARASDPEYPAFTAQLTHLRECGAEEVADRLSSIRTDEGLDLDLWAGPDRWLEPDERIELDSRTLQAIETPGHTRGHMVFHDATHELLFAGDHVLPHITPSISFEPDPPPLPLNHYLGALRKVRAMPDAVLLPAHGPAGGSVHARIDELLDHHDSRLQEVVDAVTEGAATAFAVARMLSWTRHEHPFSELALFHQMLAVIETAAHLDLLVSCKRLDDLMANGVRRYQLASAPSGVAR